jgi:phosphatidylglycerophosphate synthase
LKALLEVMPRGTAAPEADRWVPESVVAVVAAVARALTLFRLLAVVPFAWRVACGGGASLALFFAAAALSDWLDGKLARAAGVANARWGKIDAAADVAFNCAALAAAAFRGLVGVWVPAAIAVLGGRFLLRSLADEQIRYDGAGNLAGVLYYVVVGVVVAHLAIGVPDASIVARAGDAVFFYTLFALASSLARASPKSSA